MSVVFDGVTCFPVGNANLSIVNGKLEVSNIGSSGHDGILIMVPDAGNTGNNIEIEKDYIEFNAGGEFRCTTTLKNKDGLISTNSENYLYFDSVTNKIVSAWHTMFLPATYNIFGTKNGNTVFDDEENNPQSLPAGEIATWVAIIGGILTIGKTIYDWIFGSSPKPKTMTIKKVTFSQDTHANTINCTYTETEDPVAMDVEVGGQTYNIDTWGIRKTYQYQNPNFDLSEVARLNSVLFTGKNIEDFKIYSITLTPVTVTNI